MRQHYDPGLLGLLTNPFYLARRGLREAIASLSPRVQGRTLDIGCGRKPYRDLFRSSEYVGLEIDTPENRARKNADCYYDGTVFPFPNGSFDSIVCSEVLEHVFEPAVFLAEMCRILRDGGLVLLTVPFVWDEHEQPADYARYSSFGLRHLLEKHGFVLLEQRKTLPNLAALCQLINAYTYKVTAGRNPYLNLLWTVLLMSPVNLLGRILGTLLPDNPDLYLDNVVLAQKQPAI